MHTLCTNMQTLRTVAGRPPLLTPFGENASPPPPRRRLLTVCVCMCDGCGLSPHVRHKNVHGRTVHLMARRPSQPGERTVHRFMSSVPAARKWIWGLVVICAGVNTAYIIFPHSVTLGNKYPDHYVSHPCMDFASCRYSSTAATVQILRQSRLLLTTTAWAELRNIIRRGN